jgi:hypothetical protein
VPPWINRDILSPPALMQICRILGQAVEAAGNLDQERSANSCDPAMPASAKFASRTAFARRDLPLKLAKRQRNVQRQPSHGGGGVELPGDRHEGPLCWSDKLAESAKERSSGLLS